MTNKEFINQYFIDPFQKKSNGNLHIREGCLYNYQTCLVEFKTYESWLYNAEKYSRSTSAIQSLIRQRCDCLNSVWGDFYNTRLPLSMGLAP
jgi:hypothetical protein